MKQNFSLFLVLGILMLSGCYSPYDWHDYDYPALTAVTISKDSLRRSVKFLPPQNLHLPGKIYTYGQILLVVDRLTGVHIINNSDPRNPVSLGFIAVIGCNDIAVKNTSLYIDNAIDLVTVSLADVNAPKVSSRVQDVFPQLEPPETYRSIIYTNHTNDVVIGWKDTVVRYK